VGARVQIPHVKSQKPDSEPPGANR
jgi:hypothetical protein